MFVGCLMGKGKVFQADEAAIVKRLSTGTKWDLGITSLNGSCAERRFRLGMYNVMVFVKQEGDLLLKILKTYKDV